MPTWVVLAAGFLVHAFVFISVFDIYFQAIVLPGLPSHRSSLPPPAKRLVFIVADGLRADKTFMLQPDGSTPTHFLRSIAEKEGAWGVSTAGVPTATRPGHVALTAGFQEDPTSVTKDIIGENIVFDDIFEDTTYTWTWDTPQFLDKISDEHQSRIFSKKFPGDRKYLAGINPKDMDSWVFQEVSSFLKDAKDDNALKEKMNKDKVLFFLHLGGIDHAGYIVRPNSPDYSKHLKFIDEGVKDIVGKFEDFFGHDGKTTFVFTSDHGLNNWGAHGEGTPSETQCPLLVWGAGIRKAQPEDNLGRYGDSLSQDWSLTDWKRTDIEQPSLAPLMAATIGITFPKNAMFPLPDGFLELPDKEMFEILYANLEQMLDNFQAMERYYHRGPLAFGFRAFRPLSGILIDSLKTDIQALRVSGDYATAKKLVREKLDLAKQGIRHYQHYSKNPLLCATFLSLFGWFCYCALVLIQQQENWEDIKVNTPLMTNTKHIIMQIAAAVVVIDLLFLYAQSTSLISCIHLLMPFPVWTAAVIKWYEIGHVFPIIRRQKELLPVAGICAAALVILIIGMSYRILVGLLLVGFAGWTAYAGKNDLSPGLMKQWFCSLLSVGVLAGRPVGDRDLNYELVLFGGVVATVVTAVLYALFRKEDNAVIKGRLCRHFGHRFLVYQIAKLAVATIVMYYTSYLTDHNIRTPGYIQLTSWIMFFVSLLEPVLVNTDIQSRLVAISLGMLAPYILLSIGPEPLSYVFLIWSFYLLIEVERNLTKSQPIFLPKSSNEYVNRKSKGMATSNGKSHANGHPSQAPLKHHKHTKSNDILIMKSAAAEWQSLDFSKASEAEAECNRMLTASDLRRALFTLLMAYGYMFASGLVASINSFDAHTVFCFITVSNPPKMGPLIVFKICMPGFVLACFLRAVNMITFTSLKKFSLILMMMCEFVGLIVLYMVTFEGDWADIGSSLSRHLIWQAVCMFVPLMLGVAYLWTTVKLTK